MRTSTILALTIGASVRAWSPGHARTVPQSRARVSQLPAFMTAADESPPAAAGLGQLGTPEPGFMSLVGERDACGVGFIVDQKGRRRHDVVSRALRALTCMEVRAPHGLPSNA